LKLAGVPQTRQQISAVSGPKFTIFSGHVNTCLSCEDMALQSCGMVCRWRIFGDLFASCISSELRAARFRPAS